MEAQAGQWAGAIVLMRPIPVQLAATVSVLLMFALGLFLATGHYTRKVTVTGRIMPAGGAIKAVAPQFGRIVSRNVREGDAVAEGQPLYEISSERSTRDGDIELRVRASLARRRLLTEQEAHVQSQQLELRRLELQQRQMLLKSEVEVMRRDEELQRKRVSLAEDALRRFETLRAQGFASALQLTQAEIDLADQQSKLQAAQRSRLATVRELAQSVSEEAQTASQIELARVQMARTLASLEQEAAEQQGRGGVRVLAPAAGIVTALAAELGESVNAGVALATIVPKSSQFEAHLQVASNAIGFIAEGQPVRLRLAAFPYQKFGYMTGKVRSVEQGPMTETAAGAQYKVAVSLDRQSVAAYGKQQPLKAGMALEADIRQDRRRLFEWLLEPLKSVASRPAG